MRDCVSFSFQIFLFIFFFFVTIIVYKVCYELLGDVLSPLLGFLYFLVLFVTNGSRLSGNNVPLNSQIVPVMKRNGK